MKRGRRIITGNLEETEGAGEEFAGGLKGGELVLLRGELGSGKTAFVRGMARGLGVEDPEGVSSPSYTLANEYEGPIRLVHADLYRIDSATAIGELALEEMIGPGAVVVVEWGEKLPPEGLEAIEVEIRAMGEEKREIEFHHGGHRGEEEKRGFTTEERRGETTAGTAAPPRGKRGGVSRVATVWIILASVALIVWAFIYSYSSCGGG